MILGIYMNILSNIEKLYIVKDILVNNIDTTLGGSLSLIIRNIIPERIASDIDIITSNMLTFDNIFVKTSFSFNKNNDMIYDHDTQVLRKSYKTNINDNIHKICVFYNPYARTESVIYNKTFYKLCDINTVLNAKEIIVDKVSKHIIDIKRIYKSRNYDVLSYDDITLLDLI